VVFNSMTKDSTVAAHHSNKVSRPNGKSISLGQCHDELVLLTIEGDPGTGEGKRRTNGKTIDVVAEYSTISANNDDSISHGHDEPVVLAIEGDPGTGKRERWLNRKPAAIGRYDPMAEYSAISADNDDPIAHRHDEPVFLAIEGDPRTRAGNGRHDMERVQPGLDAAHNAGESGWIQEVMSEHMAVPPDHKNAAAELDDKPVVVTVECNPRARNPVVLRFGTLEEIGRNVAPRVNIHQHTHEIVRKPDYEPPVAGATHRRSHVNLQALIVDPAKYETDLRRPGSVGANSTAGEIRPRRRLPHWQPRRRRGSWSDRFHVRAEVGGGDLRPIAELAADLARWRAGGRNCSLRSGRLWPGCGPNVAQRSQAWKARPGIRLSRDAWPFAQLSTPPHRPLLSVGDRQRPMLRARGGHGR
jgi:hypothetical protein